jgi:hypothetical protein
VTARSAAAAAAAVVALALASVGALAGQSAQLAQRGAPEEAPGSLLLDVPFVAQERLLCGAAAVEMALRHAGAVRVYARDFGTLVREAEGGIRTDELAAAVRALGWETREGPIDPSRLRSDLAAGTPVTVLLSEGGGRYHYVLVVGWSADSVMVHDPDRGPALHVPASKFNEKWEGAGRWALVVVGRSKSGNLQSTPSPAPPAAEDASPRASDGLLLEASEHFRESRWQEAARAARAASEADPSDPRSWALLATSRYLAGDLRGALDAWARSSPPTLDRVVIAGLRRTRQPVVQGFLGLRPGDALSNASLGRARRRLDLLPSTSATSLSYRALPGALVVVEGSAIERPLLPSGLVPAATRILPALVSSELSVRLPALTGNGEAASVHVRWSGARPAAGVALQVPNAAGLPGVLTVRFAREQERHAVSIDDPAVVESRTLARVELTDWATAWLRWQIGTGTDRWDDGVRAKVAGAEVELSPLDGLGSVTASVEGAPWQPAAEGYARWDVEGRAGLLPSTWRWDARVRLLAAGTGAGAPRTLWPGAGVGRARGGLLRAHPIEKDGALSSETLGTGLLSGTFEVGREVLSVPLARLGAALFVDLARISQPASATIITHVDVGAGVRLDLQNGRLRLDAARGRDGSRALSLGWETSR